MHDDMDLTENGYWVRRGRQAEDYLRDVVYGGVDGLAYVRSLAEFVTPSGMQDVELSDSSDMEVRIDVFVAWLIMLIRLQVDDDEANDEKPTVDVGLGMPLAKYVEEAIVDPLTDGRHRLLRETARRLCRLPSTTTDVTEAQLDYSLHTLPNAARSLVELRKVSAQALDMGVLIKAPNELFIADTVWAGRTFGEEERKRVDQDIRMEEEAERRRVIREEAKNGERGKRREEKERRREIRRQREEAKMNTGALI